MSTYFVTSPSDQGDWVADSPTCCSFVLIPETNYFDVLIYGLIVPIFSKYFSTFIHVKHSVWRHFIKARHYDLEIILQFFKAISQYTVYIMRLKPGNETEYKNIHNEMILNGWLLVLLLYWCISKIEILLVHFFPPSVIWRNWTFNVFTAHYT